MSVFTPLQRHELEAFLAPYGLGRLLAFEGIAAGTENSNFFVSLERGEYVLTLVERGPRDDLGFFVALLDVLQRAGVAVLWRDNNSGCKGACDRVPNEDLAHLKLPEVCRSDECYDEVLLSGLQDYLAKLDRDAVVVLHMKGSHGPAYYKRYPEAFGKFAPVCSDNQLDRCAPETIVNAYDNTLLYTDHVLSQAIELLKHNAERVDGALLYMSDHGESLGENGIYLHGLPYGMAPSEQTHIPMVLWLSQGLQQREQMPQGCLEQQRDAALSHDNLFHSVLGLMDVRTSVYRPELDLFRQCRPQSAVVADTKPPRNEVQ